MTLTQLETLILNFKAARDLAIHQAAVFNQMTQPPNITFTASVPSGSVNVVNAIPVAVVKPIIRTRAEFQIGVATNVAAQLGIDYTPPVLNV